MGMSYEEAKKLGGLAADLHPQNPKNRGKKAEGDGKNEKGQNRTEAKFEEQVLAVLKAAGEVRGYWFEPFKFLLAGSTSYRLDFLVQRRDGSMAGVEVKGFMRDDAAVKVKVAAAHNPWLDIYVAKLERRNRRMAWTYTPVTRDGFGRADVGMAWVDGSDRRA